MKKLSLVFTTLLILTSLGFNSQAKPPISVELELPVLDVDPYHKPYVAIWLETPKRKHVTTIALWANDMEWYKDLRQWWRKAGRQSLNLDGVTGATQRSGTYTINWDGKDLNGQTVAAGDYMLNIEASREEGGREFIRLPIALGQSVTKNKQGKTELGAITAVVSTH